MRLVTLAWTHPAEVLEQPRTVGTRYDLVHVHLCASLRRLGHDAQPLIFRQLPRIDTLAADLCRREPDAVVIHAGHSDRNALAAVTKAVTARSAAPLLIPEALPCPPARPLADPDATCLTWAELAAALKLPELAAGPAASPWREGTVPAVHAAALGVLIDEITDAGPGPRDPDLVVADLRTVAGGVPPGQPVPLVGAALRRAEPGDALVRALRDAARHPPVRAEVDAAALTATTCRELRRAGVVALTIRVPVDGGTVPVRQVRRALMAAAAHIPRVGVVVEPPPGSPAEVTTAAVDLLAPVVPYLTVRGGAGHAPPRPVPLPGGGRRPSVAVRAREAATAGRLALAQVLSGRYPAGRGGLATTVTDLWWSYPDPPAQHSEWLAAVAGPGTTLWVTDAAHLAGPLPFLGAVRHAGLVAADPSLLRLPGHDVSLPLLPYRTGRTYTGVRPVVLYVDEDEQRWLADADAAWRTGGFAPGFLNPMTILRDADGWRGGHHGGVPPRLVVGRDGGVRTGFHGAPVMWLRDGPGHAAQVLRGPGPATGAHRPAATRPWWGAYLSVRDALKAICGSHAARLPAQAWSSIRVTGFGERATPAPPGNGIQVVTLPSGRYAYSRRSGRVATLSPTAAAIADAWLRHGDGAVMELATRTGQAPERVWSAVASVVKIMDELEKGHPS